jgi:hypothetical protein
VLADSRPVAVRQLSRDTRRGLLLSGGGIALLALGALIPVPTGGGAEALAAGLAVLGGFSALLLGITLYLLGTRV